jgi:hypothetical protein
MDAEEPLRHDASRKELSMSTISSSMRAFVPVLALLLAVSVASVSAHVIRGLGAPTAATAFVSSPSATADLPIPVVWGTQPSGQTPHRVVCFYVANTSPERADRPGWPRVMGAGFELPGAASGFALIEPLDGWTLVEGVRPTLAGTPVSLDVAIIADGRGRGRDLAGIPPGQAAVRGSGTRFCVSGPFPAEVVPGRAATIEEFINGVVVGFYGVDAQPHGIDLGIWENPARVIPLYP